MIRSTAQGEFRHCPGYADQPPHDLPNTEFYDEPKRKGGGKSLYCKSCKRARNKKYFNERYYPENKQRLIEAVQQRRADAKE